MIFYTLNSSYEVDGTRARFLEGVYGPSGHFSPAQEWKEFTSVSYIETGEPVTFCWPDGYYTSTSRVTSIGEDNDTANNL